MDYKAYRLRFPQGVHFGQTRLESSGLTFQADRLFSALCHEALAQGEDRVEQLASLVRDGRLLLSDAFPYADEEYFIPKPMAKPNAPPRAEDVALRKIYKKLDYIPLSRLPEYLSGKADVAHWPKQDFARFAVKVSACIEPGEDTVPYRIGTFWFHGKDGAPGATTADCGLYILVGYEAKDGLAFIEELLDSLSFSGIGGRRSSGLGRFELHTGKFPAAGIERLQGEYKRYMTLSVALPRPEEMERALDGARYLLSKRSGFVASAGYAPEFRRKRDVYAFQSGSTFRRRFQGELRDVGNGGRHPVYRYLYPLFMGLTK